MPQSAVVHIHFILTCQRAPCLSDALCAMTRHRLNPLDTPYRRSVASSFPASCLLPSALTSFVISPTYDRIPPPRCRFLRAFLRSMDQRNRILIVDDDP